MRLAALLALASFPSLTFAEVERIRAPAQLSAGEDRNYTSLWWNPDESGWGLNVNHQGDIVFATLFTYDRSGSPMWLVMSNGARQPDGSFSGDLYQTTGSRFDANPFPPITAANITKVGTMTLAFASAGAGTLTYTVNGVAVTKAIQQQVFGSAASVCRPTQGSRASSNNFQDLWWSEGESGWGVNITHQDNTLFATLFTYDEGGKGQWLVMSEGKRQFDGSFSGDLYRTTGPAFDAKPFTPISGGNVAKVGTMVLQFSDGITGLMSYRINGVNVTKSISRQVFSSSVPSCVSAALAATKAQLCKLSSSFFSSTCDGVPVPYSSVSTVSATIFGANQYTLDTFTITAVGGPLTISGLVAVDDNRAVVPAFSGISNGQEIAAGQSVSFRLISPLTQGRQASLRFALSANGSTVLDVRYALRTN
jgi:hypothetical protein